MWDLPVRSVEGSWVITWCDWHGDWLVHKHITFQMTQRRIHTGLFWSCSLCFVHKSAPYICSSKCGNINRPNGRWGPQHLWAARSSCRPPPACRWRLPSESGTYIWPRWEENMHYRSVFTVTYERISLPVQALPALSDVVGAERVSCSPQVSQRDRRSADARCAVTTDSTPFSWHSGKSLRVPVLPCFPGSFIANSDVVFLLCTS